MCSLLSFILSSLLLFFVAIRIFAGFFVGTGVTKQELSLRRSVGFENHAFWPFLRAYKAPITIKTILPMCNCNVEVVVRERKRRK